MYNYVNKVNNNISPSLKHGGTINWGESHLFCVG